MTMKKRIEITPGVKYRGYGYINEFGEFEFIPEQKGANEGRRKCVKTGDGWTVATTRNFVTIHLCVPIKLTRMGRIIKSTSMFNECLTVLNSYEF